MDHGEDARVRRVVIVVDGYSCPVGMMGYELTGYVCVSQSSLVLV